MLKAKWNLTEYNITYNLNWWTNNANNPSKYTVDSWTFWLYEPTRNGYMFLWWTGSNWSNTQNTVIISKWSMWDRVYNAVWWEFNDIDVYYISKAWNVSSMTIMDRNMWASSDDTTAVLSHGYHYQWWNNHWFQSCYTNGCGTLPWWETTSQNQVNVSWYSPSTYNSGIFIWKKTNRTTNVADVNLWWWGNDNSSNNRWLNTMTRQNISERQWPCPAWYHVPSFSEFWYLVNDRKWLYASEAIAASEFVSSLKIPIAGRRRQSDAKLEYIWSSSLL